MRKFLLALGILALLCSPAMAGKNSNGAMIVHTNDALTYTGGVCGRFDTMDDPGSCEAANTQTNKDDATPALVWFIATWLPAANPGVTVIYFGLEHNIPNDINYFPNFGFCGPAGSFEIPDAGWPLTGFGNSVALSSPIVGDTRFPFYYWNVFGFAGAFIGTGINPTGGYAAFVDDSNPPVQDNVTKFGTVRWGTFGQNECPEDVPILGACCLPTGECIITPPTQCAGVYQGDGTVCDPNPCPQREACCFEDEHCEDILAADCVARGGTPQGPGSFCTPDLCVVEHREACCFDDGHCEDLFADACLAGGGHPQGAGTACAGYQCPQPETEACCFQVDGHCEDLVPDACIAGGGTPQGPGTDCATTVCPPVATETTTWGAIKANYR
jgi:hypothetical protein